MRLLVDGDVVRQSSEEVQLPFDEAQDFLGGYENFEVAQSDYSYSQIHTS